MVCAANWSRYTVVLFIFLVIKLGWVYDIISHLICSLSSISFAYFTHFSNLNASPELMQIFANGERRFDSFREFYAIHLKNIGARAGGGCRHPSYKYFWNCSCKTLLIRAKYSGENTLKGSRSQTWRLLSLTFALSRRGYLRSNNLRIRVFVLEKPYIVSMCIAEIHEMDITSNKKTMTESKQTKTKTFVFVVALKWVVLNGSTKSCFQIFLRFTYEEEFTVFDFNKLSIEVIEYARFQNN